MGWMKVQHLLSCSIVSRFYRFWTALSRHLQNLRLCVTSRSEFDIKDILKPLAFRSVSLENESGQKRDIEDYIESIVHTDDNMKSWNPNHKWLVINALTEKADGM
jgi:hypothetical protein